VGLLFAITAVGYAAGNFIAGRFSVRIGMNRMVLWGTLTCVAGLGALTLVTLAGVHSPFVFFGFTLALGLGNGMTLPNANAGMLSIKPELAGTASGLGGAIQIGGGAALAALAGTLLTEGATELPLVLLMLASAICALFSILAVIRRARTLGLSS
jgi:DHA1 family bicyclomycin/chloramphenicol resistance-like MFS transporter